MSKQRIAPKPQILVVDDDHAIRQLLCTIIRREHLEADSAADGAEAIEKIQRNRYSCILLDLMMPRVSGFEVIESLRRNPPPPPKPMVLVISAYADQRFRSVDPGVVAGVLRKPFEVADIGNLLRFCVRGVDDEITERLRMSEDGAVRRLVVHDPVSDVPN
ncbi:MAG TPA: response regulator [Thermoanaerobaculia bacterium]|nr:response regulator [Thermoanaerobaculia bacterium]